MIPEIVLTTCFVACWAVLCWKALKGQNSNPVWRFSDTQERSDRIHAAVVKLIERGPGDTEVHPACRAIANDILLNCAFLVYVIARSGLHDLRETKKKDKAELRLEKRKIVLLDRITRLRVRLAGLRILLLFRTAGERHRRSILRATREHARIWLAYFRLLIQQYPEQYGSIALRDGDRVESSEPCIGETTSRRAG